MFKDLAKSYLSFDSLMGEDVAQIVFYFGVAGIVLVTFGEIVKSMADGFWSFLGALAIAPLGGIAALIVWRLACEAVIVAFRINARLERLTDRSEAVYAADVTDVLDDDAENAA